MNAVLAFAGMGELFRSAPAQPDPYRNYANALAAERAAWDVVKDRLPGTDGYSPEQWATWQSATHLSEVARRRMIVVIPERV